jgi:O-Antigen ligase
VVDASDTALPRGRQIAAAALVLVGALFAWGAWRDGAFFAPVFYPGAIAVFALFGLLLFATPIRARVSGPALIAVAGLAGIGVWSLVAIAWSPDRTVAVSDAYIAFLYAALFGVGVWTCALLGRRVEWALAPVAAAGALVAVGTTIVIASGHDLNTYLHPDATLRFPIGYRNGEAAFLMIAVWALLSLAVGGRPRWPLRAAMLATTTLLLELVVLSQSRGSLPAAVVALVVYLLLTPNRLRQVAYLLLAAVPVLVALPTLLEVFQHGEVPGVLPSLRAAAKAVALTTLLSLLLSSLALAVFEPRLRIGPTWTKRISRSLAAVAILASAVGVFAFLSAQGGPVQFVDQRISEFKRGVSPSFNDAQTRFGVNVSSEREDLWRVAAEEFADHPVLGGGPGSFQFDYLRERRTQVTPRDPHGVELLMLSELGLPGFALLVCFLVGATVAAMRSRRVSRSAAVLSAGALAAGSYWLVHSSYDWFWHYPAVTAPVMFMLGAAAMPGLRAAPPRGRVRLAGVALLAVLALGAIPFFLAARYTDRGLETWQSDPGAAYEALDRAASLDPFDMEPLLIKGAIADRLGSGGPALSAFEEAAERVPESYAPHYFIGEQLLKAEPARARRQLAWARRLNPLDPEIIAMQRRLPRR